MIAEPPESSPTFDANPRSESDSVLMPEKTVAPLVLSLGIAVAAMGVAFGMTFLVVGAILLFAGLGMWISHLRPGRGHIHEPLAPPELRPAAVMPRAGKVAELHPGVPGYRFRLPEKVQPLSAGIKGGIVGGLVMPIPALTYGVLSGHGIWYPINLLTGMVLPGMGDLSVEQLEAFRPDLLIASGMIHIVISLVVGLIYGVLMPTLPSIPHALAWGGLLMPLLWSGTMFLTMGFINPLLSRGVDWMAFIFSQFLFGIVVAVVVQLNHRRNRVMAGILGGLMGGLVMPLPAFLWAISTGHSIWYPVNLLAAMVNPSLRNLPAAELELFHLNWLVAAIAIHLCLTILFGVIYGLFVPRFFAIPAPLAWGGLLLPLLWTGMSYGLMGVVNPLLQQRVDWPWFVVSQFIFGIAAAIVVVRSEMVFIPPAGPGREDDREAATRWLKA